MRFANARRQRVWRRKYNVNRFMRFHTEPKPICIDDILKTYEAIKNAPPYMAPFEGRIYPAFLCCKLRMKPKRKPKALRGPRIHEVSIRRTHARMTRRTSKEALWEAGWKHDKDPWLRYL